MHMVTHVQYTTSPWYTQVKYVIKSLSLPLTFPSVKAVLFQPKYSQLINLTHVYTYIQQEKKTTPRLASTNLVAVYYPLE